MSPQITPDWRPACMLSSQGPFTQNNIRLVHRDAGPELRAIDPSAGWDAQPIQLLSQEKGPLLPLTLQREAGSPVNQLLSADPNHQEMRETKAGPQFSISQ